MKTEKEYYYDYIDIDGFFMLFDHKPDIQSQGGYKGPFKTVAAARRDCIAIVKDQIDDMRGRIEEIKESEILTVETTAEAYKIKDYDDEQT